MSTRIMHKAWIPNGIIRVVLLTMLAALTFGCGSESHADGIWALRGRTLANQWISVYKPLGFAGSVAADESIDVSMAETSVALSVGKCSSPVEFDALVAAAIDATKRAYKHDLVTVVEINVLGKLDGRGVRIHLTDRDDSSTSEEIYFLAGGPPYWCVHVNHPIITGSLLRAYNAMIESLARVKGADAK
jgi:hypothetical protein